MTIHHSLARGLRRTTLAACLATALSGAGAASRPGSATQPGLFRFAPHGVIVNVTSCADSGPGSLRDTLADAIDGELVGFDFASPCTTIQLQSAIPITAPNVSIIGPEQGGLTIDGGSTDRIFHAGGNLGIANLTITHGFRSSGLGGCILADGDLELYRSTITGCEAGRTQSPAGIGLGGAVDVLGNLIMSESTISDSTAVATNHAFGGGAYVRGTAYLYHSTITANSAIEIPSGSVNIGYARGGGLFAKGDIAIYGTSITDNTARASGSGSVSTAYGGGIYGKGSVISVSEASTISGNTAHSEASFSYGGGISARFSTPSAAIYLVTSTLSGNTVSSSTNSGYFVSGGGANAYGGAIVALNSAIINNSAAPNPSSAASAYGGGLATYASGEAGEIVLLDSTVSGNNATGGDNGGSGFGGGIAIVKLSPFFAINSTVAFNIASDLGGGIAGGQVAGNPLPYLSSTIVANNQALGGADIAYLTSAGPFTIGGSNNLVMNAGTGVTLPADTLTVDPGLQPLADNGGPTMTHALAANSPAIDQGTDQNILLLLRCDQRSAPYARRFGAAPDIGAFEVQAPADYVFGDGFELRPFCP